MSLPVHLGVVVAEYERDGLTDGETVQMYADLIIGGCATHPDLPMGLADKIADAIADGTVSPHGDVLRWPGEGEGTYSINSALK